MSTRKKTIIGLIALGILLGLTGAAGFNASLSYTETDKFCLGCHNHDIPHNELQQTAHYTNASGVTAKCADCHLPPDFGGRMLRKLHASREVWGHITGVIDTDKKYLEHRQEMKTREIGRFREWDSSPCKTCHDPERMDYQAQSAVARDHHLNKRDGKTCIDCHQGLAHTPVPEEDDFDF